MSYNILFEQNLPHCKVLKIFDSQSNFSFRSYHSLSAPYCKEPTRSDRVACIIAILMSTIFLLGIIQNELPSSTDENEVPLVTNIYKTGLALFALQFQRLTIKLSFRPSGS